MYRALREGGIISTQSECVWLHLDLITNLYNLSKKIYKSVDYAYTTIPTYPSGQIGFMICSKSENKLSTPKRTVEESLSEDQKDTLRYYNENIHRAAFILPTFAAKALQGKNNSIN
jgi:spermidine synthase